ncbi:hypothetical protein WN51_02917 [Melipona quadrifasciata]|uniref:Uncharacterized protein n=1 Tax=Melipona quadrifasciata TaxID=166423 RepID=A0A0N0U739_9HYME|nr:hypothetical protein WN51_02917 [Melipona quadrifasciata]
MLEELSNTESFLLSNTLPCGQGFWRRRLAKEVDHRRKEESKTERISVTKKSKSIVTVKHSAKIQLFKEKLSKSQPPGLSSREEQIALRSVKGQLETAGRPTNRLPPPVVIRRKQIPLRPVPAKQQDSSVAESSVSDEGGARSVREESNALGDARNSSECSSPQAAKRSSTDEHRASSWALSESSCEKARAGQEAARARKWGFLAKSTSTNGTARVFTEAGTTSTSSSSYERDLQAISRRPAENVSFELARREAGRSFAGRISDSTSSDFQEESELSSEERDALIEGVRTPLTVCRNRLTKFGARRRIVAAASSSTRDHFVAGDRLLGVRENTSSSSSTVKSPAEDIHASDEIPVEKDSLAVDLSSGKPASAPTTLSLGRKITSWTKEGKDLLVKSVSSANTLAPATMTCIKSPRAMSEHLLGQLEVPVTPAVLGALRVKGGSLKEGERSERVTDVPRQRWSSVRVKGGSTKSLLLENGGPQTKPLKGALTAESSILGLYYTALLHMTLYKIVDHLTSSCNKLKSDYSRESRKKGIVTEIQNKNHFAQSQTGKTIVIMSRIKFNSVTRKYESVLCHDGVTIHEECSDRILGVASMDENPTYSGTIGRKNVFGSLNWLFTFVPPRYHIPSCVEVGQQTMPKYRSQLGIYRFGRIFDSRQPGYNNLLNCSRNPDHPEAPAPAGV